GGGCGGGGEPEGRGPKLVPGVDIGAGTNQEFGCTLVIPIHCPVNRGRAIRLRRVHIDALPEQCDDGSMVLVPGGLYQPAIPARRTHADGEYNGHDPRSQEEPATRRSHRTACEKERGATGGLPVLMPSFSRCTSNSSSTARLRLAMGVSSG